jgi:ligand-binding sensor domain-containing protein
MLARSLLWAWFVICASAGAASARDTAAQEPAYTQDDRWRGIADVTFRHLGAPDMRFASAITQDGQGFLWLATQAGLIRWDGYREKSYRADPQDPHSLPDNYVMAVHTDELGRLWVGTSSGGLALYDPDLDRFVVIGAGAGGLVDPDVTVIAADGSRGLWVGTASGLNHVDLATNAIRVLVQVRGQRSL